MGGSIAPAIPLEWVAEVWVDPQWYAVQEAEEPMPSPGLPAVVGLTARSLLIGRVSPSRNIHPDIDCTADTGVSRRHAQLTTDGQRWFVEDLGSSNGTFVGPASGPLPEDPIPVGPRTELDGDDRIYVGAWTRIVVRNATDDEKAAPDRLTGRLPGSDSHGRAQAPSSRRFDLRAVTQPAHVVASALWGREPSARSPRGRPRTGSGDRMRGTPPTPLWAVTPRIRPRRAG